jgi:hypothetical protein
MKLFLGLLLLLPFHVLGQAKSSLVIDCSTSGLSIETLTTTNKLNEKLIYEQGETSGGFKYSKTEFLVNGKELKEFKPTTISKSDSYLVMANARDSGKGFNRKVYVFTYFYDLDAKEVTRQITIFPDGKIDKTVGKCIFNQGK